MEQGTAGKTLGAAGPLKFLQAASKLDGLGASITHPRAGAKCALLSSNLFFKCQQLIPCFREEEQRGGMPNL